MQNRRTFIKYGLQCIATAQLLGCSQFLLAGKNNSNKGFALLPTKDKGQLRIYDWNKHTISEFETPLSYTHAALQSVANKNEIILFEQYGPVCAIFDLASKKIKTVLRTPPKDYFYGHGVFSSDGKYLLSTEIPSSTGKPRQGHLSVRDANSLEKIHEIPSYGYLPHDVTLIDHDTIAVANQGNVSENSPSNVCFISLSHGALINKIEIGLNDGKLTHLAKSADQEVFVSCVKDGVPDTEEVARLKKELTSYQGEKNSQANIQLRKLTEFYSAPMYFVNKSGLVDKKWSEEIKDKLINNFSVFPMPDGTIISAHSKSSNLIVWKNKSIYKIISLPDVRPAGIALSKDGSELMVGGSTGLFRFFNTENFSEIKDRALNLGAGPVHLLSYS